MKQRLVFLSIALSTTIMGGALADEGMWTLDHLPLQQMQQRYGFAPDAQWIDHVQKATVRLAHGCSGSFVSQNGLVMTNHHCANTCLSQLSKGGQNYMADGFRASRPEDEPQCPDVELNQLDSITDVTPQVNTATAGKSGTDRINAERAIGSSLERACVAGDAKMWRCDMVSLYHGGRYAMYKYRRYQDVHLVFAPEQSIAFFGGDPDNFTFPRYDLDVTFFRVYDNGQPAHTPAYLRFRPEGAKANEMTFVVGNPGSTQRDLPWIELEHERDYRLVPGVAYLSELRGVHWQYSKMGSDQEKQAQDTLFGIDNSLKVFKGRLATLSDRLFSDDKQRQDAALLAWVDADTARKTLYGNPWSRLERAQQRDKELYQAYSLIVEGRGLGSASQLIKNARILVQGALQRQKPDSARLSSFRQANLPAIEQSLEANIPIYPEYEQTLIAWSLEKLRQGLGADDPLTKQILGKQSPDELAAHLVQQSQLANSQVRQQIWAGGQKAIEASKDPLIQFMRRVELLANTIRTQYENEVQAPMTQASETIAHIRFARFGTTVYPDATFTPRLSYGKVVGWRAGSHDIAPFTEVKGLYARATGAEPFKLPESWIQAKSKIDLSTPFNFVTDNDIIGGNSGSPVIDRNGRAVGLIFDGNLDSLGGDYVYDGNKNRAVAVDTAVLVQSVRHVYHLPSLADELINGHK